MRCDSCDYWGIQKGTVDLELCPNPYPEIMSPLEFLPNTQCFPKRKK